MKKGDASPTSGYRLRSRLARLSIETDEIAGMKIAFAAPLSDALIAASTPEAILSPPGNFRKWPSMDEAAPVNAPDSFSVTRVRTLPRRDCSWAMSFSQARAS